MPFSVPAIMDFWPTTERGARGRTLPLRAIASWAGSDCARLMARMRTEIVFNSFSNRQILRVKIDGQFDIFSLGVLVDEMAAGSRPFLGDSLATISNRILAGLLDERAKMRFVDDGNVQRTPDIDLTCPHFAITARSVTSAM